MERRISECLCASLVLVACGTLVSIFSNPQIAGLALQFADLLVDPKSDQHRSRGLNNKGVLSLTRAPKLAFKALQFLRILHQLGRYEGVNVRGEKRLLRCAVALKMSRLKSGANMKTVEKCESFFSSKLASFLCEPRSLKGEEDELRALARATAMESRGSVSFPKRQCPCRV
ncbi:Beta-glucuronidase [Durusdinium trenchii]|uniref:Beta-glucuronidase n=1 Tax=Durusdinium trenchii TaxID=1381693 RepID=A0ABP0KLT4_9DINO